MKLIPKGWHRLRRGSIIQKNDKYLSINMRLSDFYEWLPTESKGYKVGRKYAENMIYIRKNKK